MTALIGTALKGPVDTDHRVQRKVEGVLTYIYERTDPSLLTTAEAGTLLAWLDAGESGEEPNEVAVQECRALLHEALPDGLPGQMGLPLEDEEGM